MRQQQYERQLELNRQNEEKEERLKRERVQNMLKQINTNYAAAKTYPATIKNGWHNVYVKNQYDFCEIRKVYVESNKITQYVINDWMHRRVSSALPIKDGYTTITINESDMNTIIFLEYIYEPTKTTPAPPTLGTVSFWNNKKGGGAMKVWVDDIYVGEITSFFKKQEPNCGQSGTLSFKYKPGTYNYKARNNKHIWSGTVTIKSGQCDKKLLNK